MLIRVKYKFWKFCDIKKFQGKWKNLNLHSYHSIHFRLQARNAPPSSNQTGRIGRWSRSVGVSPLKPSPPRPGTTWIVVRRLPPTTWKLLRLAWACALPPSSDWVSYHTQPKLIINIAVNYWLSIKHLIRMIIHAKSLPPSALHKLYKWIKTRGRVFSPNFGSLAKRKEEMRVSSTTSLQRSVSTEKGKKHF